ESNALVTVRRSGQGRHDELEISAFADRRLHHRVEAYDLSPLPGIGNAIDQVKGSNGVVVRLEWQGGQHVRVGEVALDPCLKHPIVTDLLERSPEDRPATIGVFDAAASV